MKHLEIVQKSACAIIQGKNHVDNQSALAMLGLNRLDARRYILSLKFAKKANKSKKYSSCFVKDKKEPNTGKEVKTVKKKFSSELGDYKSQISLISQIS